MNRSRQETNVTRTWADSFGRLLSVLSLEKVPRSESITPLNLKPVFYFSAGESGNGASEPHNESDRRVLEFQGRVYTRPDARPGSTFRLQITADVIIGKSREGLMLMSSGSKDQDLVEEFMRDRAGATVTFVGKIVTGDKGELDRLSPPTPTPRRRKSIDLQLSLTNRSSNRTRSYKLKQIKRETPYSHL